MLDRAHATPTKYRESSLAMQEAAQDDNSMCGNASSQSNVQEDGMTQVWRAHRLLAQRRARVVRMMIVCFPRVRLRIA